MRQLFIEKLDTPERYIKILLKGCRMVTYENIKKQIFFINDNNDVLLTYIIQDENTLVSNAVFYNYYLIKKYCEKEFKIQQRNLNKYIKSVIVNFIYEKKCFQFFGYEDVSFYYFMDEKGHLYNENEFNKMKNYDNLNYKKIIMHSLY